MRQSVLPFTALAGGVLAFSTSGVLTKLCSADAVTIAFWVRVFSLAYLLGAWSVYSRGPRRARLWRAVPRGFGAGCLFAVHLLFFFAALKRTSVTVVFLLSALNPALVAVSGAFLLGERVTRPQAWWTTVAIAAAAVVVVTRDPAGALDTSGNLLAVLATVGYCAYFLASRKARMEVDTLEYMTVVTGTSLLLLALVGMISGSPFAPGTRRDVLILALMGLVPATTGHFLVNWSLGHVPAHVASTVLLAVPLFASLWAQLLVGERVSFGQLVAGLAVLAAIPGAVRRRPSARVALHGRSR